MSVDRLRGALTARSGQEARAQRIIGDIYLISGAVEIDGSGETVFDVNFPVQFIERPSPSGTGELQEGTAPVAGGFPIFSVGIGAWNYHEREGGSRIYYGARLIIVGLGHPGMLWTAHYQMMGKALTNPVGGSL